MFTPTNGKIESERGRENVLRRFVQESATHGTSSHTKCISSSACRQCQHFTLGKLAHLDLGISSSACRQCQHFTLGKYAQFGLGRDCTTGPPSTAKAAGAALWPRLRCRLRVLGATVGRNEEPFSDAVLGEKTGLRR